MNRIRGNLDIIRSLSYITLETWESAVLWIEGELHHQHHPEELMTSTLDLFDRAIDSACNAGFCPQVAILSERTALCELLVFIFDSSRLC